MQFDIHRLLSKGKYDTDFSNIKAGSPFPSPEVKGRNAVYRFNKRLYTGEYAKNKKLLCKVDGIESEIPYKVISLNFFKLIVNKLDSLIFSNEVTIKTGDVERDKIIQRLIERTRWASAIRRGVKQAEIYGDCILKTYRHGVSVIPPLNGYKVLNKSDIDETLGYVLYEPIYKDNSLEYMRFEIHTSGYITEIVHKATGTNVSCTLGDAVDYVYRGRKIPKDGAVYPTNIECGCVQWLSINRESDGVYGQSSFLDIKDIIFTLEQRLSSEMWVIDNHEKPFLVLGMNYITTDEETGGYQIKAINGKYLINTEGGKGGYEYLTWDGKLDNSSNFRGDLLSYFYELSELGKTYLSGEYSGNISEETLNNTIKSAIDRGNRDCTELYYDIRHSLYVLCRLNDIELRLDELNISFNIGRTDDDKQVAEIIKIFTESGVFSKATLLERYFGFSKDQANAELAQINTEKGGI